jgi:hypothetical protein
MVDAIILINLSGIGVRFSYVTILWTHDDRSENMPIIGPLLQAKAEEFAKELEKNGFHGSSGWLSWFKEQYDIVTRKICGER